MAQRTQVVLEDDLEGGPASETVTFALDGVTYEIDLHEDNAQRLRDDLAPWIAHGRRSGGRKLSRRRGVSAPPPAPAGRRTDIGEVRQWARDHGFQVSDRGRVSTAVQEAYDQAHG